MTENEKLKRENAAAQNAILKVGEFIRQTGNEVRDLKKACLELTMAMQVMNEKILKILIEIRKG